MEMTNKRTRRNRRGFVLPLTVAMIVLLTITGLGLQRLGSGARTQAAFVTTQITATAAADAGFTKAIYEMNKNLNVKPWDFSNVTDAVDMALTSANADYSYTIEEIVEDTEYRITSTGRSAGATKTVSATIRPQSIFDHPVYAQGYPLPTRPKAPKRLPGSPKPLNKGGIIDIKGYNLDSYSSDPSQAYSGIIAVRTNNTKTNSVKVREGVVINLDIAVGPGGIPNKVVEIKQGASVTGDIYAASERQELLPVPVPSDLENQPLTEYKWHGNKPITGNVKYSSLIIPKSMKQKVKGDCKIYVIGDMKIEESAKFIITQNSSLKIYVGGELEVKKSSKGLINETQDPKNLIIYGMDSCRRVKIENREAGAFYGAVYAPFARVDMKSDEDLYGAFVGWDVNIKKLKSSEHGTFYFDRSLRTDNVAASDEGVVRFVVKDWREI